MKRGLIVGVLLVTVVGVVVGAGWAYQHQVWLRDDYTEGYTFGLTPPPPGHRSCQQHAQDHSASEPAQVVFDAGCEDARDGRDPRPEAAGDFVSDAMGLWHPLG